MFKGLLFFIKEGLKYDRLYIIWNILHELVNAPLPIIASLLPKLIIDGLADGTTAPQLLALAAVMCGCVFALAALSVYFSYDGFTRRCRVAAEFDSELHRRLCLCDYGCLESPQFLDMQEKAKKFLYCNYHGFGYLLDCAMGIFGQLLTLCGIAAIIASLSPWIVLLFVGLSLIGAIADSAVKRRIKRMEDSVTKDQRGWMYYADLFDKAEYAKELRIYHACEWLLEKERVYFERVNSTLAAQNREFMKSGVLTALFTFIQQFAAYAYLIYAVLDGTMSAGDFMMYSSAVTVFASAFRGAIDKLTEIRAYDMYYDDLESYLSVPCTLRSGKRMIDTRKAHTIEFRNVSFAYPGSERNVLKNVSITLGNGEKLLIAGENGAGKTTFVKLLMRLYDPTDGVILLDGIDIREYNYDSYMSLFSTVFQDHRLYSFTVAENVAMDGNSDPDKVNVSLRRVGLDKRISRLERGIDTEVHKNFDENGFEPSGGEGQKLAIARALYKDAPFVILDEPTAALDPKAEAEIYRRFDDAVNGKTAVCISHRLSSAKFCDRIAVFEDGVITEYGTHAELIEQDGKYAALFGTQKDYYTSL